MLSTPIIAILLLLHWFADFVCQSHEVASRKSTDIGVLTKHVLIYANVFFFGYFAVGILVYLITPWTLPAPNEVSAILGWYATTFVLHWMTDYWTSKWSSSYYKAGRIHDFYVVVGLDQFIHQVCTVCAFHYFML